MATFTVNGMDSFADLLSKLENVDDIADKMIKEGVEILEDSLKSECSNHKKSGDMVNSIKSVVKKNIYGRFGFVRPTGKDSKGVRNMEKLAYLHFGTSKQNPAPVITQAVVKAEKKVLTKMQDVYDREVNI